VFFGFLQYGLEAAEQLEANPTKPEYSDMAIGASPSCGVYDPQRRMIVAVSVSAMRDVQFVPHGKWSSKANECELLHSRSWAFHAIAMSRLASGFANLQKCIQKVGRPRTIQIVG
jgi:hypothetical protein